MCVACCVFCVVCLGYLMFRSLLDMRCSLLVGCCSASGDRQVSLIVCVNGVMLSFCCVRV